MSEPARVVFRADADRDIGTGHVVRCLALANLLAADGHAIAFASSPATMRTAEALRDPNIEVLVLGTDARDEPAAMRARWPDGCAILVVDHYRRGARFEQACRRWAGRILSIDDLPDRPHDCDILLDSAAWQESPRGAGQPPTRLLLGPDYALLRAQFPRARPAALRRRRRPSVSRLFVCFGGIDQGDLTSSVLNNLAAAGAGYAVDVAIAGSSPNLQAVRSLAGRLPLDIEIHVDATHVAALMSAAEVAIGAAGSMAWERCCLGLPSVVTMTAANQRGIARRLGASGAATVIGTETTDVGAAIVAAALALTANDAARSRMSEAAACLCDGKGTARVLEALRELRSGGEDGA